MPSNGEIIHLPLTAATIPQLDGTMFGAAIDVAIQRIQQDIYDRPFDGMGNTHKRKLVIELEFDPVAELDETSHSYELIGIMLEPRLKSSYPPVIGTKTDLRTKQGKLHFNRDLPGKFHQPSLYPED